MGALKMKAVLALLKMAYSSILRGLLVNAIEDPEEEWDDLVLKMVDALFDYDQNEE